MKQYVQVEMGDDVKLLRFGFNAVSDVEEYFGKGIGFIFKEDNVGFSTVRAMYWAGLKWKEKGLTIERTGEMLQKEIENGKTVADLMEPILKALQYSGIMGNANEQQEENTPGN